MSDPVYGIAVFHNRGDVLAATPIARQLKADDPSCRVTYFTSRKYEHILAGNPYLDEVVGLEGDPEALDGEIPRLKESRSWRRFFTPAAYMNKEIHRGRAVFETVRDAASLEWTVPFEFVLRLSPREKAQADRYWSALPEGPKILVETEFFSDQSAWTEEFAFDLIDAFGSLSPVFLFTAGRKPPFLEAFRRRYPKAFWCKEPFRLNAEFYNRCDLFVGVSSGISALTLSDACRRDVLHLEVVGGWPWGAACLGRHRNLYVCFNRERYKAILLSLAARLAGESALPDFSPLPALEEEGGRKIRRACPVCGWPEREPWEWEGPPWVSCKRCRVLYRQTLPLHPSPPPPAREGVLSLAAELAGKVLGKPPGREGAGRWLLAGVPGGAGALEETLGGEGEVLEVPLVEGNWEGGLEELLARGEGGQGFRGAFLLEGLSREFHPLEVLERVEYFLEPGGILFLAESTFKGGEEESSREVWPPSASPGGTVRLTLGALRGLLAQAGFYPLLSGKAERSFSPGERKIRWAELLSMAVPERRPELQEELGKTGMEEIAWIAARKRGPSKARLRAKRSFPPPGGPPG